MSQTAKTLAIFFALLAFVALGHDVYLWQTTGFPFAFAALGWLSKNYVPDQHQAIVEMLGAETFNMILTPVLRLPACLLMAALALVVMGVDLVHAKITKRNTYKAKPAPADRFKRSK